MTDEVMDAGLSEKAIKALEAIVLEGYKGWTDAICSDRSWSS
ncbi:hypothetical protein [Alloactinosynnema sp. L-07]|nr:hypothetical protein [Alloactinosynnema sp. L-07]